MDNQIEALRAEIARVDQDVKNHARTITALVEDGRETRQMVSQLLTDKAVRAERDTNLNERLDRIEQSIRDGKTDTDKKIEASSKKLDGVFSLGKWLLGAFGAAFVAALANFVIGGHLAP